MINKLKKAREIMREILFDLIYWGLFVIVMCGVVGFILRFILTLIIIIWAEFILFFKPDSL